MSIYSDAVLADSPVGYLRLGEGSGSSAADSSGNSHGGTYANSPSLAQGGAILADPNTAVAFASASSRRVDWDTLGTLGSNLLTSTWEFWIKTTTTAGGQSVLGTVNTGTSLILGINLNAQSDGSTTSVGSTSFQIRIATGSSRTGYITTNIYDGNWHHVVFRVDSESAYSVFVDGVSQTVTYTTAQTLLAPPNFGFPLALAARNLRGVFDRYADISLDEVAAYSTQLSNSRIAAHWAAAHTELAGRAGTVGGGVAPKAGGTAALGGALGGGVPPSAAAAQGSAGAVAGGRSPTAAGNASFAGAVGGGFAPSSAAGVGSVGAVAGAMSPTAAGSVSLAGATAAGRQPTSGAPVNLGGAVASATVPGAAGTVGYGGAVASGFATLDVADESLVYPLRASLGAGGRYTATVAGSRAGSRATASLDRPTTTASIERPRATAEIVEAS